MASTTNGTQGANLDYKFIAKGMIAVVALGLAYLAFGRVVDAGRRVLSAPAANNEAVLAHCAQFVLLAKSRYGDDWKFRLDPRDTVCATQVQQEWEAQNYLRKSPADTAPQPTFVERAIETPPPANDALSPNEARARNPETFCLNLISLSRAKHGARWQQQIAAADAAGCEAQIARAAE